MNLLERYLTQIEKYLPDKEKHEMIKELRNLILDQLDEAVSNGIDKDTSLYNIILEMGDPRDVANNYTERKPVISRKLEPTLKLILKIISIAIPLILTLTHTIEYIVYNDNIVIMDILLSIIYTVPSTLYSLLFGYIIVYIVFFLIDRYLQPNTLAEIEKVLVKEKDFDPNFLPKITTKHFKVSIFESIVTILVTTLVIYLFNLQQGLIAITYDGNVEFLLNSTFDKLLIFINISWFVSIGINLYYIFNRRKTIISKTIESILGIYTSVVYLILATSTIFNATIIEGSQLTIIPLVFKIVFISISIIIFVITVVESVKTYTNIKNLNKKS